MMKIHSQFDLSALNTLGCPAQAEYFAKAHSLDELRALRQWAFDQGQLVTFLGEGSNLLMHPKVTGLVVQLANEDIRWHGQECTVGAGHNWHQLVMEVAQKGLWGSENLALIPGLLGAAPVQNIGAYGVEIQDLITFVRVYDLQKDELFALSADQCGFGYRHSRFKQEPHWCIVEVGLRFSETATPTLDYGPLQALKGQSLTPLEVVHRVCEIRQQKLPDPKQLPNAGSFFHNPVIDLDQFERLKARFPDMVAYEVDQGMKLAAAWLIDQCGLKGVSLAGSQVQVHQQQALVLTNPNREGSDKITQFRDYVKAQVFNTFGVELNQEPLEIGHG